MALKSFNCVRPNDIFDMDGKTYVAERWSRDKLIAVDQATGQGWKIRRDPYFQVNVTGQKPIVQNKIIPGELFIWKGRKGEAMLFRLVQQLPGKLIAKNPIDGKQWTLSGNSCSYASVDDVIMKRVQL